MVVWAVVLGNGAYAADLFKVRDHFALLALAGWFATLSGCNVLDK